MPGPGHRRLPALAAWAVAVWLTAGGAPAATLRVALPGGDVAALSDEQEIFLEAEPLQGEGLLAFSRRLTGDEEAASAIAAANGGARGLLGGVRYRVPYAVVRPDLQIALVRALFDTDEPRADGWVHQVEGTSGRSLWQIAQWFTGAGRNFTALREANELIENEVESGARVTVPPELLLPGFRALLPPPGVDYGLEYTRADGVDYAVYRLARGEALYSSVVVRFTGLTRADDVNAYAAELAALNGIADVSDIPVGRPIRIPFPVLLPEYLPPDDPRRREWEEARTASDRFSNTVRAARLEGITVILDAGHGGQDPGTIAEDVWESVYVYDIALRVRRLLESTTAARVVLTTRDGDGFTIHESDVLPRSRGHRVLTNPAYLIEDSRVGVNLRWYLANSVHRQVARVTGDGDQTVFLSIHAESLHPSLRGAMAYIPAASLTAGTARRSGPVYASVEEVRERPEVSFSWSERTKSEGLSRQLAERLIGAFRSHGLAVHNEKPVRDRIIRGRGWTFVPAVLRYNSVPGKVLLEVCNLNNPADRRLLKTRAFRDEVAQAIVDGIVAYYDQDGQPARVAQVAR